MRRPNLRAAILSILIVALLTFGSVVYAWNIAIDISSPAGDRSTPTSLEIKSGETTAEIADDLQQKGLIRNALAFRIWARIKGLDRQLQAGLYKHLTPKMSIMEITDQLLNGQPDAFRYTIVEGFRIEQIADVFAKDNKLVKFKKDEFLNYVHYPDTFPDKAKHSLLLQYIPQGYGMEGLLFATTYEAPVQSTAQDVINLMLETTEDTISKNNLEQIAKQHKYQNVYDMINLAAVVERETGNEKTTNYRPQIASVYWNRIFKQNDETVGLLNADPTSQYGRDTLNPSSRYWSPIDDPHIDGLYNTYDNKGLPPTPICSPGLASLQAAAAPADTNYYFFFAAKDGKNYFAKNIAEFEQLKAEHPVNI